MIIFSCLLLEAGFAIWAFVVFSNRINVPEFAWLYGLFSYVAVFLGAIIWALLFESFKKSQIAFAFTYLHLIQLLAALVFASGSSTFINLLLVLFQITIITAALLVYPVVVYGRAYGSPLSLFNALAAEQGLTFQGRFKDSIRILVLLSAAIKGVLLLLVLVSTQKFQLQQYFVLLAFICQVGLVYTIYQNRGSSVFWAVSTGAAMLFAFFLPLEEVIRVPYLLAIGTATTSDFFSAALIVCLVLAELLMHFVFALRFLAGFAAPQN